MTDHDLDLLVCAADPCPPDSVPDLGAAADALFEEICARPAVDRRALVRRRVRRTRQASALRTRLAVAVVTAAGMTAAIGAPALFPAHDEGRRTAQPPASTGPAPRPTTPTATPTTPTTAPSTYPAAAVRVARANPRVLVTAPGWEVRRVEGFEPEAGEMTFQQGPDQIRRDESDGGASVVNAAPRLQVSWYPRAQYDERRLERARESDRHLVTVLGRTAQMISYSPTEHAVLLPPEGKVFLELRGNVGDAEAFERFLTDSIEQVDIRTWLAAMPASVVTADNVDGAVRRALVGIPLPPGFDASSLDRGLALDRYQFGARVAGMVACGWIEEWERARRGGDPAAADRAALSLGTSRDWRLLREMEAEGAYPEVVREYADAIASAPPGRDTSPVEGYRGALGCR
jgi:hypothetical protein